MPCWGSAVNCHACGSRVPAASRICPACGEDNGYPNVRLAQSDDETSALEKRLENAETSAEAGGYLAVLNDFGSAVASSEAIIARPLGPIMDMLDNENLTYTSYHYQLAAQARTPEDNEFDRVRTQFESAISPNFHAEIRYGALTLDDHWPAKFGDYAMVLEDRMICARATVFEENPYEFVNRHRIIIGHSLPPWISRHLAKAPGAGESKTFPTT